MTKLKDTLHTLFLAARYSFAFCWKNSKYDTIARLLLSVSNTLLLYLTICAFGLIVNGVQNSMGKFKGEGHTSLEFTTGDLAQPILFLLGVLLFGVILGRLNWFFRSRWNQRLRYANEQQFNDHRATLDVARFRSKEYDDLEKRIRELPTSWQTRIWFSEEMLNLFTTIISFFLFGAALVTAKPSYALVLMGTALPIVIVEFRLVSKWWNLFEELVPHHKKRKVLEKPYKNTNAFVQALMFQQMPALKRDIEINVGGVLDRYDKIRKESVRKQIFTHLFATTGLCGVIVHAVWQTVTYGGEIGTLTILIAAARTFQGNLEAIVSLVAEQWNSAKGVILIEKEFLGLKPVLKTTDPVTPHFNGPPRIRFENVSFAYPDTDTLVLKNVSFTIEPGSKVAIVGKSGNGKSSIASLLMRHYDPSSGAIFAGDINLQNILPETWTNSASALTQEYTVLERSIAEEIASSRLDRPLDLEVVATSSRFAHFDEVVGSDPKGYSSQIGIEFGGREFSGGERQRLALARVHYRGTPILILDEPDAKLDPESAQKVIDHVFALKGITVIIITHHVSRAEPCDKVIMMGKGEIAEQGSHKELMSKCGVYATMFEKDKKRLGQ
jgi:ATP-binding cassette, subfamily B, bacterial